MAINKQWDADADATNGAGGGTGTWDLNTTANWFDGVSPTDVTWTDATGTADTATFGGTAGTVTLGSNLGALGLIFTTTGYTIAPGTGPFTLTLGGSGIDASALTSGTTTISAPIALVTANQTWSVGTGATLTTTGGISGAFGIIKTGGGVLLLNSAANTFTGGITVNAGQLTLQAGNAGTGALTFANGTIFRMQQVSGTVSTFVSNNVNIAPGATVQFQSSAAGNGYGGLVFGDATSTLEISGGTQVSFSLGASTQQLGNFLGTVLVDTGNSLRFSQTSGVNNGGGGTTFNLAGTGTITTRNAATVNLGALTGAGVVQGATGATGVVTYIIGAKGTNSTFDGTIINGSVASVTQAVNVQKTGIGTLTLTNTGNTQTGTTTVNQGVLQSSSATATGTPFGTGSIVINAGTLNISPAGAGANVAYTGANTAVATSLSFGADAQLVLNKGANTSLTYTIGNAGATPGTVFTPGTNGTLIIAPASGVAALGTATGESLIINGGVNTTNGTASGAIALQDNDAGKSGTFAIYDTTRGLIGITYTDTNFAAATTNTSVEDVNAPTATDTRAVGALRTSNALTVNSGMTLTVGNGTNSAGTIINGGSINGGTLAYGASRATIYTSAANGSISSAITGSANISFQGPGMLALSGVNTFTGGAIINNTTVAVTNDNQLGGSTSAITLTGGTLSTSGTVGLGGATGARSIVLNAGQANLGGTFNVTSGTTTFTSATGKVISGAGSLTKTGTGELALTGTVANTFTGATVVSGGTLTSGNTTASALNATSSVTVNTGGILQFSGGAATTDHVNNAAPITLSGGTLNLGGTSETTGAGTNGAGTFNLTLTSTLDFGPTGTPNSIQFAGVGAHTATTVLQVANWEGTAGTPSTVDRLLFAGSPTAFTALYNQSNVSFNGVAGYGITGDLGGFYEVYALAAVPEPSTWAFCFLAMAGTLGWSQRRRLAGWKQPFRRC